MNKTSTNFALNPINQKSNSMWFKKAPAALMLFLFPYYPLKLFKSIQLLSFLALLFALHIILVYIGFFLPVVNLQVGFDWIPTYLAGWFFGPIIGPIFGFIANNISWLQTGGVYWYWMYAIQEPIIAFFASLVSYYFYSFLNRKTKIWDWILYQLTLNVTFGISLFLIIYVYINPFLVKQTQIQTKLYSLFVASLVVFSLFYLLSQIIVGLLSKKQKSYYLFRIYLCASMIVFSMIMVFAIAAGPFITNSWLIYFHMIQSFNMLNIYYFVNVIAQILMQTIRMPIAIIIMFFSLWICIKPFEKIKSSVYYMKQI